MSGAPTLGELHTKLEKLRAGGDPESLDAARTLRLIAVRELQQGNIRRATTVAREALALYMRQRDPASRAGENSAAAVPAWVVAEAELTLSQCLRAMGDLSGALERAQAAVERCEHAPDAAVLFVHALSQVGILSLDVDEGASAAALFRRALAELRTLPPSDAFLEMQVTVSQNLCSAYAQHEDPDSLHGAGRQAIALAAELYGWDDERTLELSEEILGTLRDLGRPDLADDLDT